LGLGRVKTQIAEKNIPPEARSRSARGTLNCSSAAFEKQILCLLRNLTFSHSQGQKATFGRG
jgi:hypothetical protein